jgi:glyoxylase I family protein
VRSSEAELNRLVDPDFSEVGASGRVWTRAEIIDSLRDAPRVDDLVVSDMTARQVTADVILVTYTTNSATGDALRASWWRHDGATWRCYFHQGTPTDGAAP